ncbi:MAG TPA: GAF domain-containing protein [Bacteroidales bacterium]|nr:GAF domain-containing protein [Bacteroidales bacterium]
MFDFVTIHRNINEKSAWDERMVSPKVNTFPDNNGIQEFESFMREICDPCKNLKQFSQKVLSCFAREKEISQGLFFISDMMQGKHVLKFLSGYAYANNDDNEDVIEFGEGFPGQVANDGKLINITDIPEGYMAIESGLGKASPVSLIIFPVSYNGNLLAVIELASFKKFTTDDEQFFMRVSSYIATQIMKHIANN